MCRRISNCFRKAVKLLIRIFTCLFTCRWRRKKVKTEDDSALKQKNRLTSIRIDEDTVNTVKQLLQNTPEPVTWFNTISNDLDIQDVQSTATTNTEHFDMMDSFYKDVTTLKNSAKEAVSPFLVGAARGRTQNEMVQQQQQDELDYINLSRDARKTAESKKRCERLATKKASKQN